MKQIVSEIPSQKFVTINDIRKGLVTGIIVSVYQGNATILSINNTTRWGEPGFIGAGGWNTCSNNLHDLLDRLDNASIKYYVFDTVKELAEAVIENGWT